MVLVTATVQARADSIDELRRLSLEHVARSRAEPGCLEHGVSVDANDGLRLVFVERWADRETLAVHAALPASRAFGKAVARLAAQPPALHAYDAEEVAFPGAPPRAGEASRS
jgi:quinol monooxygenase YgiN